MLKNFLAMPVLLKLVTMSAVSTIGLLLGPVITNAPILVFGQPMAAAQWWASGAGLAVAPVAIVGCAAGFLLLTRSRYARPTYVLTLVTAGLAVLAVAHLTGRGMAAAVPTIVSELVVMVLISAYIYRSRAVQEYFGYAGQAPRTSQ